MPEVMQQIRATGYGLTFGLHSRIDATIAELTELAEAGNIYINRNVIGAVVGVQPFGGRGLSGTGPKAGGPLYLGRLVDGAEPNRTIRPDGRGEREPGYTMALPGPVGERNLYGVRPRGRVLLLPATAAGLRQQLAAVVATGNMAVLPDELRMLAHDLPAELLANAEWAANAIEDHGFAHVLIENSEADIRPQLIAIAAREGPIPIVQLGDSNRPYRIDWMLEEISISIDTTAAGGNASLMAVA